MICLIELEEVCVGTFFVMIWNGSSLKVTEV